MTEDRDFKRIVRARMQRTGERYAAARGQLRRAPAAEAGAEPGVHAETAAVVRLCAAAGLEAPAGGPPSEALVLGLGGGIGAACFTFEYKGHTATFYVATRCQPQYAYDAAFVRAAVERLGGACEISESTSPAAAAKHLRERAARGPVMAWVDLGALPWSARIGPAAELGAMPHVVVVERIEGDQAIVRDRAAAPFTLPLADLATARKRMRAGKHRLLAVSGGAPADPRLAIVEAIAACAAELGGKTRIRGPMANNFGIGGLRRWAAALGADRDPKRWTRVFSPPAAAGALAWARYWIEHAGTGGGGFRPLYARFLEEAASIAKRPALRALAKRYRGLGAAWSALATAMLPDAVPPLASIRRLQDARADAAARGDVPAMHAVQARLEAALAAAAAAPPLDEAALRAHYAGLAARVTAIADDEEEAAAALAAAVA